MTARLTPGSPAPAFTLPNAGGIPVSLSDHSSHAATVYFYPAAMTLGCTTQAMDLTGAHAVFAAAGYTIISISPDTVEKLAGFTAGPKIEFPLLSDPEHEALNAYGVFGTKKLYDKEMEGMLRSTFVIDVDTEDSGIIWVTQYNVRATGHATKLRRGLGI